MKIRPSILALATLLSASAVAADTVPEFPVRAEILSGWQLPDGRRMAGLQLVLAPGWKTYWRAPGDAGIPPEFDWRRTQGVAAIDVHWPTPDVFHEYGLRSIGYKSSVLLPLTIHPKRADGSVHLRGQMHLGVCSDVCMPFTLDIDHVLEAPASKPTPAIAAALAAMPYAASEVEVQRVTCRIAPQSDGMRIEAQIDMPHSGGIEAAVIETGLPDVWVSEPKAKRAGETFTAVADMMHVDSKPFSIDRSRVRITVIGADYAVDIQGCTGD